MFSHIAVSNTLNKALNNNNILYIGAKNLFYSLLSNNDYLKYNLVTDTEQPFMTIAHDNPLELSQHAESLYLQYHVNGLLFFHNEAPRALKKEDKHILSNKLKHTTKIFFSENIKNSWGFSSNDDSYVVPYGFKTNYSNNPTNDVLVLNFSNSQTLVNLYNHIKNTFHNSAMLTSINDYDQIVNYIKNYKIVISIENAYDTICCAANTAYVLTNIKIESSFTNIYAIANINTIINQISDLLENKKNKLEPINYYEDNLNVFYQSINTILSRLQNRVYKYDA